MDQKPVYTVTDTGVAVYIGGRNYVIAKGHANFEQVKRALVDKDYDALPDLLDIGRAMSKWLSQDGRFRVEDGAVLYDGEAAPDALSEKILRMMAEGWDPTPLLEFLAKVRENPSSTAQRELYLFCEASGFLIHEDGDVIAYKATRENYHDIQTGTIDNTPPTPGTDAEPRIIEMPRHLVDDRRDHLCSFGLHFASFDYANTFGDAARHVVVLKINPRDVVSIPNELGNKKGRTCRYEVIGERLDFTPLPEREVYRQDANPFYRAGGGPALSVEDDGDGGLDRSDEEDEDDQELADVAAEVQRATDLLEEANRRLRELKGEA